MPQVANPHDTIDEVLARWPCAARLLIDRRMHCVGCAIAPFETVAEACANYGISVTQLLTELDRAAETERTDPT